MILFFLVEKSFRSDHNVVRLALEGRTARQRECEEEKCKFFHRSSLVRESNTNQSSLVTARCTLVWLLGRSTT